MTCRSSREPLLDDIDIGDLEGQTIAEYRAWKAQHAVIDRFPGGESLDEAGVRYAEAYRSAGSPARSSVSSSCATRSRSATRSTRAAGSTDVDGRVHDIANATPYLFDEDGLARAAERIAEYSRAARPRLTKRPWLRTPRPVPGTVGKV